MTHSDLGEPAGRHVKRKHGLTRSKNGCLTCRKRRKKCNGETPVCAHCSRLSLDCEWPELKDLSSRARRPRAPFKANDPALHQMSSADSSSPMGLDVLRLYSPAERGEKDAEIHEAAQALFANCDLDAHIDAQMQTMPQPFPQHVIHNGGFHAYPASSTQEDLQAAQWLSNCRDKTFSSSHTPNMLEPPTTLDNNVFCSAANMQMSQSSRRNSRFESCSSSPEEERRFFLFHSPFEHVDHDTRILLDYFETEFAQLISVAPRANNDLLRVFLPMAVQSDSIRAALAGWSATHLRDIDDRFTSQSQVYMSIAADALDVAIADPDLRNQDMTLALALIICAVEVCKDSDSSWVRYRQMAHEIIKRRDLINNYGGRDQTFLLKNFAYHDLMSSSPPDRSVIRQVESQLILNTIPNLGGPDTYMGIATQLYCIIGEITVMAARARMEIWDQRRIATHASRLIVMVDNTEPRSSDLHYLKQGQELRQNLAMFRILQFTAKLYINQTLLKYNANAIGSQILIQAVMPLFSNLQTVLVEMLFPLFVVGVDSLGENRIKVCRMLEIMHERYRIGNVRCAHAVLEKCWESNMAGEQYVDWNPVAYNLFGQCISLA